MTAVGAARITSAAQARAVAIRLAHEFAGGAAARDRERELPYAQIDQLSSSGLLAITVPAEFGGAQLPPSVVADVLRILAAADPNIAQIPHSHFVYLNLLRLAGSPQQRSRYFGAVLDGARIANAQSERTGSTVADISTTVRPAASGYRIDGTKFYCTGSLFADILAVLTRLDDPESRSGLPPGEYVAFLPADTDGVRIIDDWHGIGQRTTGSGTVEFDGVLVSGDQLVARAAAVGAPSGYGAFAQLLHAAIDTGIARGALDAATEFVRTKSRPWFEAAVDRAVDDPLLVQRFGELAVAVRTAEATLSAAAATVDAATAEGPQRTADLPQDNRARPQAAGARPRHDPPGATTPDSVAEASIAVATAKVVADRAANDVSAALFEVSGTRSAAAEANLHHFWRNARTHTLHDPVRWKYQHIGRSVLHGTPPPLHGVI
ncbi:acyl-CoA dehydrogenase family protein [Nocardia cyriacigeorgica]|uniref:acyl-CoA dehydrogenase family protein n=1 Tax=Nocardia cyriacigeorgica TaxID=135487 RepID=UPI001895217A|nr:acyl-CoA dehydrogenase family protein [Nocardia cyriacigeorgica]MBF6437548.1 acyl-CoA dehydrogenase family protein [Nocardia cyriacigeorgica]